jgi:hypothetical protein
MYYVGVADQRAIADAFALSSAKTAWRSNVLVAKTRLVVK